MAKVLLATQDVVGPVMAGPGIRYWELSKALARHHEVTLASRHGLDPGPPGVRVAPHEEVHSLIPHQDVVMVQSLTPRLALSCWRSRSRLIVDLYTPVGLESLEHHRASAMDDRRLTSSSAATELKLSLCMADAVVCASERQRDLWIGALLSLGRVTPEEYDISPTLRHLVGVVPFGIPDDDPLRDGPGPRQRFGLSHDDRLLLWAGGIWDWLDPDTLIEAVAGMSENRPDVKLVFMGLGRPNPDLAVSARAVGARQLAERLGVLGSSVFFNDAWVPYEERQNYLLDADLGVSTHFDHVETRFAFRTRMIDYLWAELPMVVTEGDALADLVETEGLGATVPQTDPSLADAITTLLDSPEVYGEAKANLHRVREAFRWSRLVDPLLDIIETTISRPPRKRRWADVVMIAKVAGTALRRKSRDEGLMATAGWATAKLRP